MITVADAAPDCHRPENGVHHDTAIGGKCARASKRKHWHTSVIVSKRVPPKAENRTDDGSFNRLNTVI